MLFVDSAGQLIGVRALMGVGGALIMPATLSIISNVFPREERAKAIAVWAGTAAIGIGLGPLAGGLLLEWFDWSPSSSSTSRSRRSRSCSGSASCPRAAIPTRARSTSSERASRSPRSRRSSMA